MDDSTLEKFRAMIGKKVQYFKYGKYLGLKHTYIGQLVDIRYGEIKRKLYPYAVIERMDNGLINSLVLGEGMLVREEVPVENIITKCHAQKPENFTNSTMRQISNSAYHAGNNPQNNAWDTLTYCNDTYIATSIGEMKISDEVVWTTEKSSTLLVGKISWIGGKFLENGQREIIAVVQFDQPTNHLHRYLQTPPWNRNIVNINDLLPLHAWMKIYGEYQSSQCNLPSANNVSSSNSSSQIPLAEQKPEIVPQDVATSSTRNENSEAAPSQKINAATVEKSEDLIDLNSQFGSQNLSKRASGKRDKSSAFQWDSKIQPLEFYSTVSTNQGKPFGIQGNNNSCYMDSTIFSLFAFNNTLDKFLHAESEGNGDKENKEVSTEVMKNMVTSDIIKPLRQKYFVSSRRMQKLRDLLVSEMGPQYKSSYMDVEEFMIAFFDLINVRELFTYSHGGTDQIHQIVLPTSWEESQRKSYLTLQSLLDESFTVSDVKLTEIPKSAFIIKLPISDGKLIPCDAVIPNVTLNLSQIIEGQETNELVEMRLHAVICLLNSHFVTFVCMDHTDEESRWVFMDSKPTTGTPELHILDDISSNIKQAVEDIGVQVLTNREPRCNGFKLFSNAYICVYVPSSPEKSALKILK